MEWLENGDNGFMICFDRKDTAWYEIDYTPKPVADIANLEKKMPLSMIEKDGSGVTDEFFDYALPLIQGEPELICKNGMISFCTRA